jgi:hypothetical protein
MSPKRVLSILGVVLALVLGGLGIETGFAAKPVDIPVTVTFRSGPDAALDGVRGDGLSHAASIGNGGASVSYFWSAGQVSYDLRVDNVYSADPTNCPPGQVTGTMSGPGNLRVTLDTGSFLTMPLATPQSGLATYEISGTTSQFGTRNYHLRFRAVDPLAPSAPNCSTQVTITRTATGTWVVETDSTDIARLLITADKGPGFTSLGHYQPAFKMTVQQ